MAGEDRTSTRALELHRKLQQRPYAFHFFQAIRRLEFAHGSKPGIGRSLRPADDPYRLGQEPSLAFAPSMLSSFEPGRDGRPWRMSVLFFGLFGPNGPLPNHLTEFARHRIRDQKDTTLARFADLFHHRLLSLFYRAWASAQPTVSFDSGAHDPIGVIVASLVGLGMPELRDRDTLPDLAKLYFAGRLAQHVRCADGLRDFLSAYLQLPVAIEQFVGTWIPLPEECRTRLSESQAAGRLGITTTIGTAVWDCQRKFRIVCGPMSYPYYQRMLPGGDALEQLVALVRNYVSDELDWELNLVLAKEEVPPLVLDGSKRLGWTTWFCRFCAVRSASEESWPEDPDDLVLQPLAAQESSSRSLF